MRCSEERGSGESARIGIRISPVFSRSSFSTRATQKVTTGQEQVLISYQRATRYSLALSRSLSPPHFRLSNDRAESLLSRQDFFFFLSFNIVFFLISLRRKENDKERIKRETHTHTNFPTVSRVEKKSAPASITRFQGIETEDNNVGCSVVSTGACLLSRVESSRDSTLPVWHTNDAWDWWAPRLARHRVSVCVCKRSLCLSWFCFVPTSKE